MPRVNDLVSAMEKIAPSEYAEPWDNVGLLMGSLDREISGPVLLTIDLTEPVAREAREAGASAIVAYHPPIFHPLKRLDSKTGRQRALLAAAEAGMAVLSPHTALDAAPGGVTDWLADGLIEQGATAGADRRALRPHYARPASEELKIVTFVPVESLENVRSALASAGAGIIGEYELCSFAIPGKGTFRGSEASNPAVGEAGRFEEVHEHRLEMVCSRKALPLAVATLRQFHPYEEPPIEVYELLGKPERAVGVGRRMVLDQPATLEHLAQRLKQHLGVSAVKVAAARPGEVTRIGVCPGAGAETAELALANGCEAFVTGEMRHHEVIVMVEAGMSILLAGHTETERGYLPVLAQRLNETLPDVRFAPARADRSPFRLV